MAKESSQIEVEGLGIVTISHSNKARHISIRIKNGEIILVIPPFGSLSNALNFLESKRIWIQNALRRSAIRNANNTPTTYDEESEFKSLTFTLQIKRYEGLNFIVSLKEGILSILCPQSADIASENVQKLIKTTIVRTLRKEAQRVLPTRLKELAEKYGLKFNGCSVRDTKTRWGSCNGKKNISLNLYLMCLPQHLIDYVLIHELCHTVEMNHGPKFWALVDQITGRPHEAFRREMKNYHPGL